MSLYKMRISAKAICFDGKGSVLLVKGKSSYEGKEFWCAPGGGVEEGESLFEAAEREALEETGYSVKLEKIVFAQDLEWQDSGRNLEIFMIGRIDETRPAINEHDHEPKLFSKEEFKQITYLPEGADPFELAELQGASYKTYLN